MSTRISFGLFTPRKSQRSLRQSTTKKSTLIGWSKWLRSISRLVSQWNSSQRHSMRKELLELTNHSFSLPLAITELIRYNMVHQIRLRLSKWTGNQAWRKVGILLIHIYFRARENLKVNQNYLRPNKRLWKWTRIKWTESQDYREMLKWTQEMVSMEVHGNRTLAQLKAQRKSLISSLATSILAYTPKSSHLARSVMVFTVKVIPLWPSK